MIARDCPVTPPSSGCTPENPHPLHAHTIKAWEIRLENAFNEVSDRGFSGDHEAVLSLETQGKIAWDIDNEWWTVA